MGAPILTTADVIMCPHGGQVTLASSQSKVKAQAQVLRQGDTFTIAGCAFFTPTGPHPCVTVEWQNPSQKVSAVSDKVLSKLSIGMCKAGDQAVQGMVFIQQTQTKASAL
jgi:hypothetical protein